MMTEKDKLIREYLISVVRKVQKHEENLYIDDSTHAPKHIYVRYSMWPGGAFSQAFTLSWNEQRQAEMMWYPYVTNPDMFVQKFDLAEPKSASLRKAIRARFDDVRGYQSRGWRYIDA